MPEVFAFNDKNSNLAIIDGQKRLSTLIDFVNVTLPAWTGGKIVMFDDLTADQKEAFYSYQIVFRIIKGSDMFLIRDIFMRLNRYVIALNGQERRHARAEAKIIRMAEEFSKDPFWQVSGLLLRSQARMKDMEFILRLLLSIKEGPISQAVLEMDRAIAALSETDISLIEEEYLKIFSLLRQIFGDAQPFEKKFNRTDVFCLFIALRSLVGIKVTDRECKAVREALFEFRADAFSKNPMGNSLKYFQASYGGKLDNLKLKSELLLQVVKKALRK